MGKITLIPLTAIYRARGFNRAWPLITMQQDIIQVQNRRIDQLLDVISSSLAASHGRPISIQVNPSFQNSNSVIINDDIAAALAGIYELLESLPTAEEAHTVLNDLTGSLEGIKTEQNPERLKGSPALEKLGRFLRRFADGNEVLTKAISNIEKGQQIVGDLARTYNKLAAICGLPLTPVA